MSDLGQQLKKARLDKGISLEQLEEVTKIRKRYLEAIEEGDYNVLPGSFYVRAFIKSYSEAVGLNPGEVLDLYANAIPAANVEVTAESVPRRKRTDTRATEKLSKWASTILMLAFVLLIVGVIYYFVGENYTGSDKEVRKDERLTDKTAGPENSASGPEGSGLPAGTGSPKPSDNNQPGTPIVETPPPQTPVITLDRVVNDIEYYTVANVDKLQVAINIAGEECWLRIDKVIPATDTRKQERQVIEEKLYKKGDTRDWSSDTSVYMTIGFPPAVELSVNGVPVVLETKKGVVKKIQIDMQKTTETTPTI